MRIVAGRLRGFKLTPVGKGDPARRLRPTSARTRTRLFDILIHGPGGDRVGNARVLDLFAGTGALGLEALSRGAAFAGFVDNGKVACSLIRRNVEMTGVAGISTLIGKDATCLGSCPVQPFNLVLLDPPYGAGLAESALRAAAAGGWLAPGCIVAAEDSVPLHVPGLLEPLLERASGKAILSVSALAAT